MSWYLFVLILFSSSIFFPSGTCLPTRSSKEEHLGEVVRRSNNIDLANCVHKIPHVYEIPHHVHLEHRERIVKRSPGTTHKRSNVDVFPANKYVINPFQIIKCASRFSITGVSKG